MVYLSQIPFLSFHRGILDYKILHLLILGVMAIALRRLSSVETGFNEFRLDMKEKSINYKRDTSLYAGE